MTDLTPSSLQTETLLGRFRKAANNIRKRVSTEVLALGLIGAAVGIAFLMSTIPAHAETLGYPWPTDAQAPCQFGSAGGPSCTNPNNLADKYDWGVYVNGVFKPHREAGGYQYRNCTDYVAWKVESFGVPGSQVNGLGNGGQWYNNAPVSKRSSTPAPGMAAVVPTTNLAPHGHVAFVESVNPDGTITISEYNRDMQGHGKKRTGTPASMGITGFVNFGINPSLVSPPAPVDTDNDSVPDYQDDCPYKPGVPSFHGCPAYTPPASNSSWTSEASNFTAESTWGVGRLDLFRRNTDGTTSHKVFDLGVWSGWVENLGGNIVGKPGAVNWGWGRIDLFGIGTDGKLKHTMIENNTGPWSQWETLDYLPNDPGCLKDGVSVSSWGPGRLDIFALGCDNSVKHLWLNDNVWQSWDNLGGCVQSPPTAASWGPNRVDVFVRGCDNVLYTKVASESGWSDWAGLGGCISSGPAVTSQAPQRLDVFVRGCNAPGAGNSLLHMAYRPNAWSPWENWGGDIAQAPTAVSWAPNRLDVVASGPDNSTQHFWIDREFPASSWDVQ